MPVAKTSIANFRKHIKGKRQHTENILVLWAIKKLQPCSGRQISKFLKIENSNVARCLYDLKKAGKVRVAILVKCKITGVRVQHYRVTGK